MAVIDTNIRAKVFSSPDYANVEPEKAVIGTLQVTRCDTKTTAY